jgi:hypothetical protein
VKKIIALCLLLLTLLCCPSVFADRPVQTGRKDYEMIAPESYEGYWEEKAGGRLLISVTPADEPEWYDVTVAARDKLPKMDVYIMRAHYQKDGSLYYDNGLFVLRKVKRDGTVKDKVRYRNGSGLLYYSFDENVLYWTDYTLKPEKRVRSFIKTASPDADEAM